MMGKSLTTLQKTARMKAWKHRFLTLNFWIIFQLHGNWEYTSANQINQLFLSDLINTKIHQQSSIIIVIIIIIIIIITILIKIQSSSSSSSSLLHLSCSCAFVPLWEQSPGRLYESEWPHAGKRKAIGTLPTNDLRCICLMTLGEWDENEAPQRAPTLSKQPPFLQVWQTRVGMPSKWWIPLAAKRGAKGDFHYVCVPWWENFHKPMVDQCWAWNLHLYCVEQFFCTICRKLVGLIRVYESIFLWFTLKTVSPPKSHGPTSFKLIWAKQPEKSESVVSWGDRGWAISSFLYCPVFACSINKNWNSSGTYRTREEG